MSHRGSPCFLTYILVQLGSSVDFTIDNFNSQEIIGKIFGEFCEFRSADTVGTVNAQRRQGGFSLLQSQSLSNAKTT